HKEHQAHAVAEKADRGCGRKGCDLGQRRAATECQRKVDRTRRQSLDHRNLQRVGRTELARKIVVDTHIMQARTISTLPQLSCGLVLPPSGQESSIAPKRIAIAPRKMRRSTFSRKISQAIAIVASPSVLSSRAPLDAGVSVRPDMSSAGPRMPPNSTIAPSQGRSLARSGASGRTTPIERPAAVASARPIPEAK